MSKKEKKRGIRKKANPVRKDSSSHKTKSTKEVIGFVGGTDVGKVRENNEDSFIAEKILEGKCILAAAIDGLGGYEGGELAAKIAKEKIVEYLNDSLHGERIELLKQAVTYANNAIVEANCKDDAYAQMGCVLTAAIFDVTNHLVYMAHVGDSRLYSFQNGVLKKLSHDHSFVGYLEDNGDLTEEQAMNHPDRNIVDRVIGHQHHRSFDQGFIESSTFPLGPNTTFLFCSDGLTDMITSSTITGILRRDCDLNEKKDALIQAALDAGGKDNITVVLVEYMADKDLTSIQNREVKRHNSGHGRKSTETKNEKSDDKHKPYFSQIVLCLLVGLIVGFLCGFYFGRHPHVNKLDEQPIVPYDNNIIDSTTSIFKTL